ncbi:EAL domain-containing protein [Aromatoleum diolicum]|uniref:EAL domain-containing protein n=1 Tax=Aromatoleum diolicum TaxID=75796 RepID=A0ABX1QG52_9RHOO|nr:EAL domain-containing protein [Aromatoleum diolicum]NMG76918.1 EAL domain-containing protein [Aromatoleum diolicum]
MNEHSDEAENGVARGEQVKSPRVLYVEDNSMDATLARRALEREMLGVQLQFVRTVAEALVCLASPVPPYDAMFVDLRLPDGSGFELLRHVRDRDLSLPVVILTASGDHATALAALKAGADDYVPKRGDYTDRLAASLTAVVTRQRAREAIRRSSLRVLYGGARPIDVDLVRRQLTRIAPHIELEVVTTGPDVLARLPESAAASLPYDILLLDYRLQGADALEIFKTVRVERALQVPVVLATEQGDEHVVVAAMRLGVADCIERNSTFLERLPEVLEKVHQRALLQREQARERAMADRLRLVLAASPAIVYTLRAEGERFVPTWVSENVVRLMGYPIEECLQPDWWPSHVHPDDLGRLSELVPRLLAEGSLVTEYRFYDGSGTVRWIRDQQRVLTPAGEKFPLQVIGSWNDITAERETQERLRLYGVAFESSREALIITDLVPRILAVNPAFARMSGYTEVEVLGKNPNIQRSGRHDQAFFRTMWECVNTTGFWEGEVWNRRKDGEVCPQWLSISTVCDGAGQPTHYVAVASDLSELKHSEEKLRRLAHFDLLTELPNRILFELRLEHALERAQRHGHGVAVLVVDLDRFKDVNDSLGHAAGDHLLQSVAQRLRGRLRSEDTLARLAGDQFAVVMEGLSDFRDAERMTRDLQTLLESPFAVVGHHDVYLTACIGISVCPEDGYGAVALLDKAYAAAHQAKGLGGNHFSYYTGELNSQALSALELEGALRRALERHEFVLHFQPKVDICSGHVCGAEALVRWQRPEHGLVPPLQFIPQAERSGLIVPLGAWVIEETCRQMREWADAGLGDVSVAVNVSARQFCGEDLESTVQQALSRYGIRPELLMLELTESMLMERPEATVTRLTRLKRLGVRLSLDDFGTGYSSLGYLSRFPIDQLKIDRSFVTDIVSDPSSAIIATSVIVLAHRMGIDVVAEGVETEAQLSYLRKNRCDKMQGYLFSKPLPADEFCELVRQGTRLPVMAPISDTRTLLLVDDEPNILSAIRRLLRGEGYRVLTAGSAREALEILAKEPVQVILSDQRMPEMNGTEFLGRVKVLHPSTVRIVLSGYTELESIMQAVNTGALYKFLTKPWDDNALREHLRDAFSYYEAVLRPRSAGFAGQPAPGA